MKTYPLDGPPHLPGVYLLHNKASGHLYVGQAKDLRRRWLEWRAAFSLKHQIRSTKVHAAAVSTDITDWGFTVLLLAAPDQDLDALERKAIDHVQARRPADVLNFKREPHVAVVTPGSDPDGNAPKTEVLDDKGRVLTRAAAATLLGVTKKAVQKRLQAWRKKGITKVKISGTPPKLLPH